MPIEMINALAKEIAMLRARVALLEHQEDQLTPAGSIDHGGLAGLGDDDHPQYNDADTVDEYHASGATGLGMHANRIRFMAAKNVPDNTATSIIRITTPNPAGDNDGGGYSVVAHVLVSDGLKNYGQSAARACLAMFARTVRSDGTVGVTTAVVTFGTTASADTDAAQRSIGTLTVSTVEVGDEYNVDLQVLVDQTGTGGTAGIYVVVAIDLLWYNFDSAPVVAAV